MKIDGSELGILKFEAGAMMRRHVRAQIDALSLSGQEYKGLLVSTFVVRGEVAQLSKLLTWLRSWR
jgi:hypothetical protein